MADITVTTDFSQVNNLKEALQSADTAYVRVVDGIVRENNRLKSLLKKAAKDTEETNKIKEQADAIYTAKLQQEADKRERVRAREAAKAEKEAQRIEAANQKLIASEVKLRAESEKRAAASAQGFQSQIGGNLGLGARGISASASGSAFEGEIERLRQKYDQVYASSQLYERSLNELNKAHALGVLSAKQHESAVESLNQEYQNFQNGIALAGNRFATHVNQTSTGMNKFGMAAQQTGYQVSDFLVQIQGGTNPLVAFSQQATQLTGLLYIMSPALLASRVSFVAFSLSMSTAIAGVTILVPLLAMLAMAFANSGKESDKTATSVDKQTQAYDALIAKVEQLRLARQMEATGITSAEEQVVQNNLNELLRQRADLQDRLNKLEGLGGRAAGYAEQAEDEKALLQIKIDQNTQAIEAITYEQELEAAAKRRANEKRNEYREAEKLRIEEEITLELARRKKDAFHAMAGEMGAVSSSMFESADNAEKLAGVDIASGIAEAANTAMALANNLGVSFEVAKKLAAGGYSEGPTIFDPRDPRYDPAKAAQESQFGFTYGRTVSSPASGGGGGGRQADLRKEIELTKELTQAEKDRQTILKSIEGSLEAGFMSMIDGTKSVKDAFKSMAREILKELYRVLVVQRLVGGISNALSFATGPSTGSFGLPFGGAGATGGSMIPGKSYLVGENGPELVIPRHSGTVVNANQTANAMGGGGGFTQNLSINVSGSDAAMVRTEIAKMIPQITNATKAAVIDAKQRGGQMAAAFR